MQRVLRGHEQGDMTARIGWAYFDEDQTVAPLYRDGTTGSRMTVEEHRMVGELLHEWSEQLAEETV